MIWHQHAWSEYTRSYAAPITGTFKNAEPDLSARLLFGITTIFLRCHKCGDIKTVEALGRIEAPQPQFPSALRSTIGALLGAAGAAEVPQR